MVKIPRFAFEKFPGADPELTTTMKSVGEAMSLGRNFAEALNKAMRSMETKAAGFWTLPDPTVVASRRPSTALRIPHDGRLYTVERGAAAGRHRRAGARGQRRHRPVVPGRDRGAGRAARRRSSDAPVLDEELLRRAKRAGLSDRQLAALRPELAGEDGVRTLRHRLGVRPVYKTVDTCAAEFEADTPYHYSTYDEETEVAPSDRPKVLILGSGPNRIGQGIEFDYSCVHAVMALRGVDFETVMVNCNPETVSTDYDTADRLYFEPLTFEDVLEVFHSEDRSGKAAGGPGVVGVIVQLGGQTPLGPGAAAQGGRRADRRHLAGVDRPGRGPRRVRRGAGQGRAALARPRHRDQLRRGQGDRRRDRLPGAGPAVLRARRPGHGDRLRRADPAGYIERATEISPDHPVLVDRFLDDAIEIDVDALCDATGEVYLGGVMEHIEEAGIHSGDSSCSLPPITLAASHLAEVRRYTEAIARGVGVRGLLNVQYALKDDIALRAGGQPARVADRAVRLQGHRGAAGQGGRPDHARRHHRRAARRGHAARRPATAATVPAGRADRDQGGGAAVQAVPHPGRQGRGQPARPGDEVDRRGDGHRRRLRPGVRQVAGRRVRVAADQRQGLRLGGEPGQARR